MTFITQTRQRLIGGAAVTAGALIFAAGAVTAADPPLSIPFDPACNGAYAPGQLGSLDKTLNVTTDGSVQTVSFTIIYPPNTARGSGRLLDCISIGPDKSGLVASVEDTSDLTSGTFSGSYTVGLAGSGADIIVQEGDVVCDVAFLTGNDTGGGSPSGQKTPAPVCTEPIVPPTTTTIAPTTTTIAPTTTTIAPTTTTIAPTTTTIAPTAPTTTLTQSLPVPSTTAESTTTAVLAAAGPLPPSAPTDGLPVTGAASIPTVLLGFGLLAAGGAAIFAARRRGEV